MRNRLLLHCGLLFPLGIVMLSSLLSFYEIPVGSYTVRPEHVVGVAVFLLLILLRLWAQRRPLRVDWSALLVVAWVSVNGLASYLNAPHPDESYPHVLRMAILAAIYLTVVNGSGRDARGWVRALKLWLTLGVLEALYGIVGWLAATMDVFYVGARVHPTLPFLCVYGTLLERNIFGSHVASIFVMLLSVFLVQRRTGRRIVSRNSLLLGLSISGVALLLSYTRAAWIAALAGGLLAHSLAGRRWRARLMRLLTAGTVVVVAAVPLVLLAVAAPADSLLVARLQTFGDLGRDITWQGRVEEYELAIGDWLDHPWIGNGTGSFGQLHASTWGEPVWLGNLVLHTLVDTGLLGLSVQLLLAGRLLYDAVRLSRGSLGEAAIGLAALSCGLLVLLIAYQATDNTWFATFWIHLGLMKGGARFAAKVTEDVALPAGLAMGRDAGPLRAAPGP